MTTEPRLSPTQTRAVTLLARGHDRARIARTLGMALPTLDDHLAIARRRLGARSAAHLVARAIDAGIIPADVAHGTQVTR